MADDNKNRVHIDQSRQTVAGAQTNIAGGQHIHHYSPKPAIPLQRPPRVQHFTDRRKELAKLLNDLHPGQVATLCGPGGIGKTALAAEVLQDPAVINRFPDGIIFYSFYGRPDTVLALEHIEGSSVIVS